MSSKKHINRLILVIAGMAVMLSSFLLIGAASRQESQVGRYQLEVVVRRNFPDLYVIDTMTGKVKWIDSKNENKPFDQVK